jgi:hypothetical protein
MSEKLAHAVPGQTSAETECSDDFETTESEEVIRWFTPMQLDEFQPQPVGNFCYLLRRTIHKDANCRDRQRQSGNDLRSEVGFDIPRRTWVEVQTHPIDIGRDTSLCIFDASQAADLYSDHGVKHVRCLRRIPRLCRAQEWVVRQHIGMANRLRTLRAYRVIV